VKPEFFTFLETVHSCCVTEHYDSAMKSCASKAFTFVSIANMKQLVVINHRNTFCFKLLLVIMLE
jgi:hypothetical protein